MRVIRYITILAVLLMTGCAGYTAGETTTTVLPPEYRTLAIGEVENPTTISWLEPRVRKLLRDELHNRGVVTWVDETSQADAILNFTIKRYNRPTAVAGKYDETLRSVANFQFEAVIVSAIDDAPIWRSGEMAQTWPFFSGDEADADDQVTKLAIERLADRMSQNY